MVKLEEKPGISRVSNVEVIVVGQYYRYIKVIILGEWNIGFTSSQRPQFCECKNNSKWQKTKELKKFLNQL